MSKDNLSKSQIPALSNQTKSKTVSSASVASSLSPWVSANTKKRLFSETSPPSPSNLENKAKHIKMKQEQLDATLDKFFLKLKGENDQQNNLNRAEISKLSQKLTETDKSIADTFQSISGQITDLQTRQEDETKARQALQTEVTDLQGKVNDLASKVENGVPDTKTLLDKLFPLVTEALSDKINSHTAEVKAYNSQAKATYFQSLVNEIKSHEKDIMLYGFKEESSTELDLEIKTNVFENIMDLGIENFKATRTGIARFALQPFQL